MLEAIRFATQRCIYNERIYEAANGNRGARLLPESEAVTD
jgi:hypothetical protein